MRAFYVLVLATMASCATSAPKRLSTSPSPSPVVAMSPAPAPPDPSLPTRSAPLALDTSGCTSITGDATVVALYKKGCDGGDMPGCHRLSLQYLCGVGTDRDLEKAASAASRACDGGIVEGCGNAGGIYVAMGDVSRARGPLAKGCAANNVPSCNNLASLGMQPGTSAADAAKSLALLHDLCGRGNTLSCANESMILFLRDGEGDTVRAEPLARSSCDGNIAVGCNVLGMLNANGKGLPRDDRRAAAMFTKACDLGLPAACDNYGQCAETGRGMPKDVVIAKQAYTKACNAGWAHACTQLGSLLSPSK